MAKTKRADRPGGLCCSSMASFFLQHNTTQTMAIVKQRQEENKNPRRDSSFLALGIMWKHFLLFDFPW